MTNYKILKWLTRFGVNPATQGEIEAGEIIRFLAGPAGALRIADDAAWEFIMSETRCYEIDGHVWHDTYLGTLPLTEADHEIAEELSRSLRYLNSRELTVCHPNHVHLVRLLIEPAIDRRYERISREAALP